MFERCEKWAPHVRVGCWPDCDMLPLGKISKNCSCLGDRDRYTNFTYDEQKTMLSLWAIFRSPLILGGELRENRPEDLEVITNRDIIEINQYSTDNRQLVRNRKEAVWTCLDKDGKRVIALFNLSDEDREISLDLAKYGFESGKATELWTKEEYTADKVLSLTVAPHGVKIVRF